MIRRRGGPYSAGRARAASPAVASRAALYGIGVDVLLISRMAEVYRRHGARLEQRLLHPAERERLEHVRDRVNFVAKCFAVKEAFSKAFGTGFNGIAHDEVGWTRSRLGRPEIVLAPRLQAMLTARGVGEMHLTISDEKDLVCAVVTMERRN